MRRTLILLVAVAACATVLAGHADPRETGDTQVFATVPAPGMPEGIAVRDGVVYIGTHASVRGNGGEGPSKIFTYDLATRMPTGDITISGQTLTATHGILAMAFDAAGRLYVLDRNPPRLLRLDLSTSPPTQSTYATFPELDPCLVAPPPCSPTTLDEPPFPDYLAFDAAGNAYVTDLQAATIFRVPPGGGPAEIWFQDPRLDSIFGPNGIAVDPSGTTLYFAMTGSTQPGSPTQGIIYTLPITGAPAASDLQVFHTYPEPATGPDGIAFGISGKLYVALAGSNQVSILNADGAEAARFPDAVDNATAPVPYDLPASVGFDGAGSLLVTNQSYFAANPAHWVVLDVWVNDFALPPIEPVIP